jgi:hypothetical protein
MNIKIQKKIIMKISNLILMRPNKNKTLPNKIPDKIQLINKKSFLQLDFKMLKKILTLIFTVKNITKVILNELIKIKNFFFEV